MTQATTIKKELERMFEGIETLTNKKYIGKTFYANFLNNTLKFKAEFCEYGSTEYNGLEMTILNKYHGMVDKTNIIFSHCLQEVMGADSCHLQLKYGKNDTISYYWDFIPKEGLILDPIIKQIADYVDVFQD